MNGYCPDYVGAACVDGTCPVACAEEYEEYSVPYGFNCRNCWLYKGCEDCALYGTEHCDEWKKEADHGQE